MDNQTKEEEKTAWNIRHSVSQPAIHETSLGVPQKIVEYKYIKI